MTKENNLPPMEINLPLTNMKHIDEFYWFLSNKDKKAISDIIIKTLRESGHKPIGILWGIDVRVNEEEDETLT